MPSFSRTPASITEPAVGASVWASGSQVCTGNSGTLTAKADGEARKSQRAVSPASRRPSCRPELLEVEGERARRRLVQDASTRIADEQEGRAEQRVDEELERRVDAGRRSPTRR